MRPLEWSPRVDRRWARHQLQPFTDLHSHFEQLRASVARSGSAGKMKMSFAPGV